MNTKLKLMNTKLQQTTWQASLKRLKSGTIRWCVDLGVDEQGRRIKVSGSTTYGALAEELMLNSITLLGGLAEAARHDEMLRIRGELDEMARVSGNPGVKGNLMSTTSPKRTWQAVLRRLKSGTYSWTVSAEADKSGRRLKVSGRSTDAALAEDTMLHSITLLEREDGADLDGEMVA